MAQKQKNGVTKLSAAVRAADKKLKAKTIKQDTTLAVEPFYIDDIAVNWRPQPRQLTFLRACGLAFPFDGDEQGKPEADIIGYGGAAGGGKTDSLLAIAIIATLTFPGCKVGYFRREYPQLEGPGGAIMRSQELISKEWADWNGSLRRWTMPGGGIIQFCGCKTETDVYGYQSLQFDILLFDESTQFTRFIVRYLMTRNRATIENFTPFCAMATNPGNVGHTWFKKEFVGIGAVEIPHEIEIEPGKYETHVFIPSKLSDNQILEKRDPNYRKRLENQDTDTRRMMLDGDWDVFKGQYFSEFRRDIHVIKPFPLPTDWRRYRTLDYGLDMLACYWIAVDGNGKAYCYKKLHQSGLIVSTAAKEIQRINGTDVIHSTFAPPDLWNRRQETGKSAADIFRENGVSLRKANNDRVQGWYHLKEWLKPYYDEQGILTASFVILEDTCPELVENLPALLHDKVNPNDAATEPHEVTHDPDAIRYFIAGRPKPAVASIPAPHYNFESEKPKPAAFGGAVPQSFFKGGGTSKSSSKGGTVSKSFFKGGH